MASEECIEENSRQMLEKCKSGETDFEGGKVNLAYCEIRSLTYSEKRSRLTLFKAIMELPLAKMKKAVVHIAKEGVLTEPSILLIPTKATEAFVYTDSWENDAKLFELWKQKTKIQWGVGDLGLEAKWRSETELFNAKIEILLNAFPKTRTNESILEDIHTKFIPHYRAHNIYKPSSPFRMQLALETGVEKLNRYESFIALNN